MNMEMSFMEVLLQLSLRHVKFTKGGYADLIHFDLANGICKNGNVILTKEWEIVPQTIKLKDGRKYELTSDMELLNEEDKQKKDKYSYIEKLYKEYKFSVPREQDNYALSNFKAKQFNDLTMEEILTGIPRQQARVHLEAYILLENIPWNDKHWYWQSPNDKDLLIYRSFIKKEKKERNV